MAAARKRSTGSRNTSAKTSSNRKKNTKTQAKRGATEHTSSSVESEITLWIVLTISIVLLVSNFGVGGAVGNAISSFFFGLVGLICYPLPIFLFLGVAFVISNSRNPRAYRKMVGFLLLFIAMCMFMQLLTEGAVYEDSILTYYQVSAEYKTGGGILGGLLCRLCVQAFGTVGTYAITVAAIMISLVLITQKSMFDMIRKCSRWAYRHAAQSQNPSGTGRSFAGGGRRRTLFPPKRAPGGKTATAASSKTGQGNSYFLHCRTAQRGTCKRKSCRRAFCTGKSFPYSEGRPSGAGY